MRLGVIDGPGHHGPLMIAELVAQGHDVIATRPQPQFGVFAHRPGSSPERLERRGDRIAHDVVRRLAAASEHRLRRWLRTSYDFDLYTRLYGKLAARYVADCDAVIGFSLVSHEAHRQAKRDGRCAVLELPATHLAAHTALVDEEYRMAGQDPAAEGIVFSRFAVERACVEYAQADLINVLSTYAKTTLVSRGIPAEKVIVSPLGVDVGRFPFSDREQPDGRPFRVLCVGRIELAKGIRYLLEAFARLALPNAELWLVGQVYREARPFLEAHGRAVIVRDHMPPRELADCYRNADVLVFPTISDSFGLVILEAMASGLPVIATRHSGGPDVLRDTEDGFVVPIRDSSALADRILWLHDHPAERIAMGYSARARVEAMFTREAYGARLRTGLMAAVQSFRGRDESGSGPRGIA